eukprot:6241810-Alexandrium_andersonii.AAC.1
MPCCSVPGLTPASGEGPGGGFGRGSSSKIISPPKAGAPPSPASVPGAAGHSRGSALAATVALSTEDEPRAASPLGAAASAGVGGTAPPDSGAIVTAGPRGTGHNAAIVRARVRQRAGQAWSATARGEGRGAAALRARVRQSARQT